MRKRISVLALEDPHRSGRDERQLRAWLKQHRPDAIVTTFGEPNTALADVGVNVPGDVAVGTTSLLDGHCDAGVDQNSLAGFCASE